jgi:putative component of toxin-antitoxin plasmid stabilization module
MAETTVLFFRESSGSVPVLEWLDELLKRGQRKAWAKCRERIQRLAELGFELRRPLADILRDGIYELRAKHGRVNYRILYFFHGRNVGVLASGLTKEGKVPDADINRAVRRKKEFDQDPHGHTYVEEDDHGQDEGRRQNPGPEDRPQ